MKNRLKWFIPLFLLIILMIVYIWPVPKPSFEELYANVDRESVDSLVAFREANPLKTVVVGNKIWEYVVMGEGEGR